MRYIFILSGKIEMSKTTTKKKTSIKKKKLNKYYFEAKGYGDWGEYSTDVKASTWTEAWKKVLKKSGLDKEDFNEYWKY